MRNFATQFRDLSPRQRERLLEKLTEISDHDGQQSYANFSRRLASSGQLSFAQQRLWFLQEMYHELAAYNCPLMIRINMRIDIGILEKALSEIARRHEVLRTTFPLKDEQPVQVVSPATPASLPVRDLRDLPGADRESAAMAIIRAETRRPFDLIQGPCWRVSLLQLDEEDHILHVVFHHIVIDGWSIAVFFKEVQALYEGFERGNSSPLPDLPIQYLDFAIGQRLWLQGPTLQSQLAYWKAQLDGAAPLLQLPTDRPRPTVQGFAGANQLFRLPESLSEKLRELARSEDATLFMTLLAAFKTLLYRYSRQADILIGTPIANRHYWEIENLIGLFVNTLVLRTKIAGDMSFLGLLRCVRDTCLEAYAHQDLPFDKLVEELRPERDPRHTPIFQSMFVLQNVHKRARATSEWSLMGGAIENGSALFDLSLNMGDSGRELVGALEYNTEIFEDATITRMIQNFQTLLTAIVHDPSERLAYLPLISEAERRQVLGEWNNTRRDYPRSSCWPELFEARVKRSPNAVALVGAQTRLTFNELNRRANQVAHCLRRAGVGPESIVAVYLQRSVEMVVALLGVLKAGAAYLPLDPAYAAARLNFVLEDSGASALVTHEHLKHGRPESYIPFTLSLDSVFAVLASEDETNPSLLSQPENLAYVLYTSGSTGKPKGVLVQHQSLVNHNLAISKRYGIASSDRVLQFAAVSFDVAAEELFSTLLSGATVVLGPDELLSPRDFLKLVGREGLTVVNLPTSYWQEVVTELSQTGTSLPPTLRLIVIGGEKASPNQLTAWQDLSEWKPRLINAYGPTETTITTTTYLFEIPDERLLRSIPVGRPLANTQIYLLDPDLQPVPLGLPGQLCIGGDSLSRGYLKQPGVTAEMFIPNPFSDHPGARLYQTGDIARYLPDGNIEIIGRTDHQVKVRGFRIELGEIESVLSQNPKVHEAVVLLNRIVSANDAAEELTKSKHLLAYVVPEHNQSPSVGELRQSLREQLPDYMVPAEFILLDALPLTPSGKVDRQAVANLTNAPTPPKADHTPPQSELEQAIAQFWEEVLPINQIGRDDNFFDLGGHSLLLIQVNRRLKDYCRKDIPVVEMFKYPTIAALAKFLGEEPNGKTSQALRQAVERGAQRKEMSQQQRALRRESRAAIMNKEPA